MAANFEGLQGQKRRFTPAEVGGLIRMFREQQGLKRLALAAEANVSDKTVERAEGGERISDDSYRKIAIALGLNEHTFTSELFIPTPEEAERLQKEEAKERERTHQPVSVCEVRSVRDVLPLFTGDGLIADDQCVAEQHLLRFASLKQNLLDWGDIASDVPAPDRISGAEDVLREVREFEELGYVVKVGLVEHFLKAPRPDASPTRFRHALIVAFPMPRGSRESLPREVWFPRKMALR